MGNATTIVSIYLRTGSFSARCRYMAPEQLEGKPVDARADLFALGAVLYEMVTGEPPFRGSSKASFIVAILSEEPVPSNDAPATHAARSWITRSADVSPKRRMTAGRPPPIWPRS